MPKYLSKFNLGKGDIFIKDLQANQDITLLKAKVNAIPDNVADEINELMYEVSQKVSLTYDSEQKNITFKM